MSFWGHPIGSELEASELTRNVVSKDEFITKTTLSTAINTSHINPVQIVCLRVTTIPAILQ